MTPVLLVVAGLALFATASLVLRTLGPRVRVGRLLASTPRATVAEAIAIARAGRPQYVRVDGRIDSEEEFEDPAHQPLVLRRTRLQARTARRGWQTFEDSREEVAFALREGLDGIAIDGPALDDGLVVVPRESNGVAADLGERAQALAPDTPVRVRIEQVSSVEHATVLGVPVGDGQGGVARMTAGLGRPLILTTLEPRDAMRILAEGRTAQPRLAAVLIGLGIVLTALGIGWLVFEAVL